MIPDVYLLLLEFGRQHEQAAVELLVPTLQRLFPGAAVRGAVVDNALAGDEESVIDRGLFRIGGDNTMREFSGWDRGIAWLERHGAPSRDTIFVLANDTVVRPEKFERVRDLPSDRAVAASGGAMVGYVEAYPRPVELFGLRMRQWVDTSLVILGRPTLDLLKPLAYRFADAEVFAENWPRLFLEPSPFSENYRAYLRTWLFGERLDAEFTHGWHAQEPLTASNVDAFKGKLRSLVCEHLLSARARALRIPLVDIRPQRLPIDPFDAAAS